MGAILAFFFGVFSPPKMISKIKLLKKKSFCYKKKSNLYYEKKNQIFAIRKWRFHSQTNVDPPSIPVISLRVLLRASSKARLKIVNPVLSSGEILELYFLSKGYHLGA